MALKRYLASADSTITDAFRANLVNRGSGSNMGAADVLEVFSLFGQADSGSQEKSRMLLKFPIADVATDITNQIVPSNAAYFLRVFNAPHGETLPTQFTLTAKPISGSWDEGTGLDMNEYSDLGAVNWINATSSSSGIVSWQNQGGDFHISPTYDVYFDKGTENLEVEVTDLVNLWLSGSVNNDGIAVMLSSSLENSNLRSYYTKKFFARSSEFFFKRPILEARWDSSINDDRGNFFASSSLADSQDNQNTIYIYNYVRGRLRDIPSVGTGSIFVNVYETLGSSSINTYPNHPVTGGWVSSGIYSASICANTKQDVLYDVWSDSNGSQLHTGSISVKFDDSELSVNTDIKIVSIVDFKSSYTQQETPILRLFVRSKGWEPSIYTKATEEVEQEFIKDLHFRVYRIQDGLEVISYDTSSFSKHTKVSYDEDSLYQAQEIGAIEVSSATFF